MSSHLGPTTSCSRCARPWYSTQFKTCVDCRQGASLRGFRARQLAATLGNRNLSTEQPPSPNPLAIPVFSTLFFACSRCGGPCHSSYDTTTCYRCRHAASSRGPGTVRALLPAGPILEPCFQPPRISQPSLGLCTGPKRPRLIRTKPDHVGLWSLTLGPQSGPNFSRTGPRRSGPVFRSYKQDKHRKPRDMHILCRIRLYF
jgi:hypothetical protein